MRVQAFLMKRWALYLFTMVIVGFGIVTSNLVVETILERFVFKQVEREERLEDQVATTFKALQRNSQQAIELLARLQAEMTNTSKALQESQQQRTLLELSPEQRRAIEGLVRRPQPLREMLTSLDFWVGQVAINAFFFALGVMTPWLARRRTPSGP